MLDLSPDLSASPKESSDLPISKRSRRSSDSTTKKNAELVATTGNKNKATKLPPTRSMPKPSTQGSSRGSNSGKGRNNGSPASSGGRRARNHHDLEEELMDLERIREAMAAEAAETSERSRFLPTPHRTPVSLMQGLDVSLDDQEDIGDFEEERAINDDHDQTFGLASGNDSHADDGDDDDDDGHDDEDEDEDDGDSDQESSINSFTMSGSGGDGPGSLISREMEGSMFGMAGMLSELSVRFQELFSNLKQHENPDIRMAALRELSIYIIMLTEDTLSTGFSIDHIVRELVDILANPVFGPDDPESPMIACRCLTNIMDALPQSSRAVANNGAVPILCRKLLEIEYIDLAEQALIVWHFIFLFSALAS